MYFLLQRIHSYEHSLSSCEIEEGDDTDDELMFHANNNNTQRHTATVLSIAIVLHALILWNVFWAGC